MIKASSAAEISALVKALIGPDDVLRDAAIARLAVIGPRAVDRLVTAHAAADSAGRAAILRALDALADPRALPLARGGLTQGGGEAAAAVGVLRGLLDSRNDAASTEALDLLVSTALDPVADGPVRVAAFEALPDTPPDLRVRVRQALRPGAGAALATTAPAGQEGESADVVWTQALEGRLPDRPTALLEILPSRAAAAPLSGLQRLIEALRAREAEGGSRRTAGRSEEWRVVRGLLHQALALRGSRVALYDLRESFAGAVEPLPMPFLTALHAVGDASCLDALASALTRAPERNAWWRQHLASAFQTVAARERLTRRHAVMKRALAKCPALAGG